MKRKKHVQSFLIVCNKRLLGATARHTWHAGKRPSEHFAVKFFLQTIYLKKKRVNSTEKCVLLPLNWIFYQKQKDLKMGQDITK